MQGMPASRSSLASTAFLLAHLEQLFHGHAIAADEPWFVRVIEPTSLARAIAAHWHELLAATQPEQDSRTL